MMKPLITAAASLAIVMSMASPSFADNSNSGQDPGVKEQIQQGMRDQCDALITQFDNAKTTNSAALALRKRAWNNCWNGQEDGPPRATKQIKQAMKMIGMTPQVM